MGRARQVFAFTIVAVFALAIGYAGWREYLGRQPQECYACRRPVHAHSNTVAMAKGRSRLFCCPACALSEQKQEGGAVRVTQLTAFDSGAKLSPDEAWVVKGSDLNMCAHSQELIDADKRAAGIQYDRCAPSMVSFAHEAEATRFKREHGGAVLPFREVAASYAK